MEKIILFQMRLALKMLPGLLCLFIFQSLHSQETGKDSVRTVRLGDIVISSNRMPVILKRNPGSVSLVTPDLLSVLPKGIAAEEALRLVPGVRIDNQHDGERVHVSIRGQGILTERGLRGIGVLFDGIPVNDPSGFAPDLYDIDWATVSKVEVLRGPVAGLYGGGGAAGVINISTVNHVSRPFEGEISEYTGSNGFFKELIQSNGSLDNIDYHVSLSRTDGAGYRDHQGYNGNKLYSKINLFPGKSFSVTQIISHIDYFQQNPEGLNLGQFDNIRQANPDARPFNEYQKTNRTTVGIRAERKLSDLHDIELTGFLRNGTYKETSNRCAEYRNYVYPGIDIQYNLHFNSSKVKNDLSLGADLKWQRIDIYKLQSVSDPLRTESMDDTNFENDSLLANQVISQSSTGIFILYHFSAGRFDLLANIRYDMMQNKLNDKLLGMSDPGTAKDFTKVSSRTGASYSAAEALTLYANWSQGFIPPSTEELASNPLGYSGFNTHLLPATSNSIEFGARGFVGKKVYYDLTGFVMNTENDFFRFKQSGRGNQEVFYGNAGNSRRIGIESNISYSIMRNLQVEAAYTFADYKYTSASADPVYFDPAYVLTWPPASGQYLPNSPKHQLFAEAEYRLKDHFIFSLSTELQSEWAIYTDARAYRGDMDQSVYRNWQDGFNLYHARVSYLFKIKGTEGELNFAVRNIFGSRYMAFTEPDPDGNSYHPGPGREFFTGISFKF